MHCPAISTKCFGMPRLSWVRREVPRHSQYQRQPQESPRLCRRNPLQIHRGWHLALLRANFVLAVTHIHTHVILFHLLHMESCPKLQSARECFTNASSLGLILLLCTWGWRSPKSTACCQRSSHWLGIGTRTLPPCEQQAVLGQVIISC